MSFPTRLPTVPHLKEDGSNWAAFATRFRAIMQINCWSHFDGTATRLASRDVANLTSSEKAVMKEWAREDAAVRRLLSGRLPDRVLLATCHHETANALWDALAIEFGHSGNPNDNTPEGVAHVEPDSTRGEEADTNAPALLQGAGPEPLMDEEEHHSLEVEEEGIAGENASVGQDMGPRVELQHPGFSPLATQEEVGLLTPPSSPSPPTPEAASTQHSLVVNTGTSATPDSDSDNEAEEAFRTEMSGAEDEDAFGRAGLNGQLVKEGEEWMPTRRPEYAPHCLW